MTDREQFEKWWYEHTGYYPTRHTNGGYEAPHINNQWVGWQAASLARAAAPIAAPAGWKLVPTTPTSEMVKAGADRAELPKLNASYANMIWIWCAMLAAAPTASTASDPSS